MTCFFQQKYRKIEDGVVGGYKKMEEGVVNGFNKVNDKIIGAVFSKDGETVEETKERLSGGKKETEFDKTGPVCGIAPRTPARIYRSD